MEEIDAAVGKCVLVGDDSARQLMTHFKRLVVLWGHSNNQVLLVRKGLFSTVPDEKEEQEVVHQCIRASTVIVFVTPGYFQSPLGVRLLLLALLKQELRSKDEQSVRILTEAYHSLPRTTAVGPEHFHVEERLASYAGLVVVFHGISKDLALPTASATLTAGMASVVEKRIENMTYVEHQHVASINSILTQAQFGMLVHVLRKTAVELQLPRVQLATDKQLQQSLSSVVGLHDEVHHEWLFGLYPICVDESDQVMGYLNNSDQHDLAIQFLHGITTLALFPFLVAAGQNIDTGKGGRFTVLIALVAAAVGAFYLVKRIATREWSFMKASIVFCYVWCSSLLVTLSVLTSFDTRSRSLLVVSVVLPLILDRLGLRTFDRLSRDPFYPLLIVFTTPMWIHILLALGLFPKDTQQYIFIYILLVSLAIVNVRVRLLFFKEVRKADFRIEDERFATTRGLALLFPG